MSSVLLRLSARDCSRIAFFYIFSDFCREEAARQSATCDVFCRHFRARALAYPRICNGPLCLPVACILAFWFPWPGLHGNLQWTVRLARGGTIGRHEPSCHRNSYSESCICLTHSIRRNVTFCSGFRSFFFRLVYGLCCESRCWTQVRKADQHFWVIGIRALSVCDIK